MKQKTLSEIKYGQLVYSNLPSPYFGILALGLDAKSAQKVLDDLVKHGYAWKDGEAIVIYRKISDGKKTVN